MLIVSKADRYQSLLLHTNIDLEKGLRDIFDHLKKRKNNKKAMMKVRALETNRLRSDWNESLNDSDDGKTSLGVLSDVVNGMISPSKN